MTFKDADISKSHEQEATERTEKEALSVFSVASCCLVFEVLA
jgi:hypothetical protein